MAPSDEFWSSDLPFISDVDGKRVDWIDVGLAGLGTVATSFFSSWADLVGRFYASLLISPIQTYSGEVVVLIETITGGVAGLFQFGAAIDLARSTGFLGAIVILVAGFLLVSVAIRRFRS